LVKELGTEAFRDRVEALFELEKDGPSTLTEEEVARCKSFFPDPPYEDLPDQDDGFDAALRSDLLFANWVERCVHAHKKSGYRIATLVLKRTGLAPGDVSDRQMEFIADLADRYSFGEMRVTHEQNLVLADVRLKDLPELYR